jgi:hypothetical protein
LTGYRKILLLKRVKIFHLTVFVVKEVVLFVVKEVVLYSVGKKVNYIYSAKYQQLSFTLVLLLTVI